MLDPPLTPLEFHVLLALSDGPQHGYAIGKLVEERSDGQLKPGTGSLYQVLRRLRETGLITPVPAPARESDARRQYFRLSAEGRKTARAEAARMEGLVSLARSKSLLPSPR
jgi:DNA-binding PadR family transcriptional regulator